MQKAIHHNQTKAQIRLREYLKKQLLAWVLTMQQTKEIFADGIKGEIFTKRSEERGKFVSAKIYRILAESCVPKYWTSVHTDTHKRARFWRGNTLYSDLSFSTTSMARWLTKAIAPNHYSFWQWETRKKQFQIIRFRIALKVLKTAKPNHQFQLMP